MTDIPERLSKADFDRLGAVVDAIAPGLWKTLRAKLIFALHEIEQAAEQRAWQPIETAPRYKLLLIGCSPPNRSHNVVFLAKLMDDGWWTDLGEKLSLYEPLTWMFPPNPDAYIRDLPTTAEPAKGA